MVNYCYKIEIEAARMPFLRLKVIAYILRKPLGATAPPPAHNTLSRVGRTEHLYAKCFAGFCNKR